MFYPLVVLDVTAHEVSHGFTEFNSALAYQSQSGGINEAFSDMAGEAAEFYMRGSNDWKVGGEIAKSMDALRFMDDPTQDGNSIAHVKDFKEPTDEFSCLLCMIFGGGAMCAEVCGTDVHHSSGIYNKVFHDVATSAGWNTRKAFDIFVKANQDYWTEQTNFQDGAAGVRDAARDLGYDVAPLVAAFKTVGIDL
jgi:vibriolysin